MEQLIVLMSVFIVVWIAVYLRNQSRVEHFTSLPTRKCTVWFTDDMDACNEGMFHKDTRSIQYMRDNLVGDMEKQLASNNKQIADNLVIINDYRGMQVRAIRDKIQSVSSQIVAREKANLTNRNQALIDIHQRYLDNIDWYANYYFRTVPQLEAENIRLQNSNTSLNNRINQAKASVSYKNIDATLKVKLDNPNFRCKNEYHSWDEPNSSIDSADNDPIKLISATTRGNPYTWASCTKVFPSESAKINQQNYIENKKFPDVEVDFRDVPGLTNTQNKATAQIRFQRFNQGDLFECDDTLVTPVMPSIPNGLLEVKLDNRDIIQSIRVVKYGSDSRYIDPAQTKNIGQIDGERLQELFFDTIYEAWPTQQLYVYPKKGRDVVYRVHYVYYDNKCQRFFPNTTKPLGVSKGGDFMPSELPYPIYRNDNLVNLFARNITNKAVPTRYYINNRNPSGLPIFGIIREGLNKDITEMEKRVSIARSNLNTSITKRNYWNDKYNRAPVQVLKCWRGGWNWRRARWNQNCRMIVNTAKVTYLSLAQRFIREVTSFERLLNNELIPKLNTLYATRTAFQSYLREMDAAARAFSTATFQTKLQSFVGKPATELIGSYKPSYISNNNTLYLGIKSYSKATLQVYTLDDTGRMVSTPEKPSTVYDILDEDTTYENTFTVEEVDPASFLYISDVAGLTEEETSLLRGNYASLYTKNEELVNEFNTLGTFDITDTNLPEDPVTILEIAPGTRVEVINGSGSRNTFDNSTEATTPKRITLNSTMTTGYCTETDANDTGCLMTRITISKY